MTQKVIDEDANFITMIKAENLIAQVQLRFPRFEITHDMEGLPTVIFVFLSDKLVLAIQNNDHVTQNVFISLINEMADTDDAVVGASFSEMVAVCVNYLGLNLKTICHCDIYDIKTFSIYKQLLSISKCINRIILRNSLVALILFFYFKGNC